MNGGDTSWVPREPVTAIAFAAFDGRWLYLDLALVVGRTVSVMVAVVVDVVGAEVVALVAILGNVSVVDVHVGLMIVAAPPAALLGQRGLTPAPPEDGQGSVS